MRADVNTPLQGGLATLDLVALPGRATAPSAPTRRVFAVRFDALTPAQRAQWESLRAADPQYDSAFFSSALIGAIAAERDGVEVAIVEEAGRAVAVIPFRRGPFGVAMPAGGPFGDFDGLVAERGIALDVRAVLSECGLACWIFEHAPSEDDRLIQYGATAIQAPFIDTLGGFEAYARARNALGGRELKGALRKARRAAAEVGALRFEPNIEDPRALDALLAWKRDQVRARGAPDPISARWAERFLRRVATMREAGCTGMLSGLYLGDRLAALSLGVRSGSVLHGWITVYDPHFARHSPGVLLLIELVRAAERLGIARIDMGPGREPYKWRFNTGARSLFGGAVHTRPVLGRVARVLLRLRRWTQTSPLLAAVRSRLASPWNRAWRGSASAPEE